MKGSILALGLGACVWVGTHTVLESPNGYGRFKSGDYLKPKGETSRLNDDFSSKVQAVFKTDVEQINMDPNTFEGYRNIAKALTGEYPNYFEIPEVLRMQYLDQKLGFEKVDNAYSLVRAWQEGYLAMSEVVSADFDLVATVWNYPDRALLVTYLNSDSKQVMFGFNNFVNGYVSYQESLVSTGL